jgi:hypothetical protein
MNKDTRVKRELEHLLIEVAQTMKTTEDKRLTREIARTMSTWRAANALENIAAGLNRRREASQMFSGEESTE